MKINKSGANLSAIVNIAQRIKKLNAETGNQYLPLNRGINSVCNIDLTEVVKSIDFNSNALQVYPPSLGRIDLKEAINKVYFGNKASIENITITGGSTVGLDIAFQVLVVEKIYLPLYYWTTYDEIMTIRRSKSDVYRDYDELEENLSKLKKSAVIICDPGNPVGDKYDDDKLLSFIKRLNRNGTIVILDSPYRRMFYDETDTFYQELMILENVVIVESFSKSVGLSGQRIGFVHSSNRDFNTEFGVRLVSATNGINAFSQLLVEKLLASEPGIKAVTEFKRKTVDAINLNIRYLEGHHLLAGQFYQKSKPVGIFVVVNKTEEELLANFIGSVSLSYFTRTHQAEARNFARICVSFPHEEFKRFFDRLTGE
ncbi:MAG: pyridoxal phosphate-dependent aminotransferase [Candidatus Aminicenantes bacterium]|nr:MAG: pyridoxal phosphate-dependent aminotransferase [Candidatus Aminicenantes bacterium]